MALFDELEVHILIIAKNPGKLKNTCEYLSQHGWPTTAVSEIPKGVEYIKANRPHIVLVSYNHPSPAIYKLPELLDQSKEMICIAFVEQTDGLSVDRLTTVKTKYKIYGEPSGANFHRGVGQILTSLYQPADDTAELTVPRKISKEEYTTHLQAVTKRAVALTFKPTPGVTPAPLPSIRQVGVIPFESKDMPGYLVVARDAKDADKTLLSQCATAVQEAYANTRLPGNFKGGFWLECPEVQFAKWSGHSAFSMKCAHENSEVGVAFFESANPIPKIRSIKEDEMSALELDQLSSDCPLACKVYLYFRTNKKYFLYLRDGRKLQNEQKVRLLGSRVKEIYVKTSDVEELSRFWATMNLTNALLRTG